MSLRGKNINLYLIDGSVNGRYKCTLANWTGVAYKIPRTELDKCKEREDFKQSGVYFLFGCSNLSEENFVYIGQAGARKNGEGILNRLQEHKRNIEKDYWTEAVVFTTSNNSLGPTEISYLENRFYKMAAKSGRYTIKNNNNPTLGNITEEKESELEEFVEYAKIVMGTLGHKIFEPLVSAQDNKNTEIHQNNESAIFVMNTSKVNATCRKTSEGIVLLKGSEISPYPVNSCSELFLKLRKKHKEKIENNILKEDILFSSPSSAASFAAYASRNGWDCWVGKDGKKMKETER